MANNKFNGYSPKHAKPSGKEGTIYSGAEKGNTYEHLGDRLDRVNPYEFRKGMDYELTAIGCSRLAESTIEEREKATESVLKNLEEVSNYYTAIVTYETKYRNTQGSKPSFKSWLSEQDEFKMKEVDQNFKNDKMTEPKTQNLEVSTKADIKMKALKENKKTLVSQALNEQEDIDLDDEKADKAASKGDKKSKSNRFDLEKDAIENLLYRGKKGKESEYTKDEPSPESILAKKDELLDVYKSKLKGKEGGADDYNELLKKANEKFKKQLEKHVKTFGADGKGNNVVLNDVFGATLPETIKALGVRLTSIAKEEEDDLLEKTNERYKIAETDMTREQHIKLLEICRKNGANLREGAMGVRMYYEIAKEAYLEGLANGLRL